ncbi:MAG TPA: PIG-L family deacetylase [Candidatus Saccharimonadales bacterium]|jgi:LmbE family N-acetylglucosaminyl deacetylase|nr:PIG-L family deacetylase [Candidatus Saccharimonadales bacterium]
MPRAKKKTTPVNKPVNKTPAHKTPVKKSTVIAPLPVSPYRLVRSLLSPVRVYALLSVAILLASAWYWALLGAHIHMNNSDQLVNTYLFGDTKVFHGALWPDQHTFLLKWPVFLAIRLFGATAGAFTAFTVALVLLTVGLLAFILYRIERRPLAFGTLCLALASVLLLVPAQPYPGGVLPVNMAMVTTRNIEYLVFIAAIAAFVYAPRMRHWKFGAGIALLVVLIASDKLFLTLGAGGAILALVVYVLARKRNLAELSARWLVASIAGGAGAVILLWLIGASNLTNIVGGTVAGPYGLVHSLKELMQGIVYMALGLLTNLGANPASDTRLLATIPGQIRSSLLSAQGAALVMNSLLLLGMLAAVAKLMWSALARRADHLEHDKYFNISVMLTWVTITACGVFVISKHYYPVDARYLTIAMFTGFIVLATVVRTLRWRPRVILAVGMLFGLSVIAGIITAGHAYTAQNSAMADTNKRDELIAKAISQHTVDWLVGDYWRVLPTKLHTHNMLQVAPLGSCAQPGAILNSKAWQPNLDQHSFAYLLTLDRSLTGYPPCNLDQIIQLYGRPNASTLIAGTLKDPHELLLFYDRGAHQSAPRLPVPTTKVPTPKVSTVVPVGLDELPYTSCAGPSVMNIVAHQDDDLLFMNPDTLRSIRAGECVRTVYITSGDAGAGKYYWVGREQGSEAAYSNMLGNSDIWIERLVKLSGGQFITVANPRGNSRVSLVFMHLPDGNLRGQGFSSSQYESLERLGNGQIHTIHAIDHESSYTADDLTATLNTLMRTYQPSRIRTQATLVSIANPDHSDHMAVGRFTKQAHAKYLQEQFGGQPLVPLSFYIGYPVRGKQPNLSGQDLKDKENAFFAYAKFDGGVCDSEQLCMHGTNYGTYLSRQYLNDY